MASRKKAAEQATRDDGTYPEAEPELVEDGSTPETPKDQGSESVEPETSTPPTPAPLPVEAQPVVAPEADPKKRSQVPPEGWRRLVIYERSRELWRREIRQEDVVTIKSAKGKPVRGTVVAKSTGLLGVLLEDGSKVNVAVDDVLTIHR